MMDKTWACRDCEFRTPKGCTSPDMYKNSGDLNPAHGVYIVCSTSFRICGYHKSAPLKEGILLHHKGEGIVKGYYGYVVEVIIETDIAKGDFDIHDMNYYMGDKKTKPYDFDLHLALYLLEKEGLSPEILEPLKKWVKENKMVVSQRA